ncbi:hypothetical protein [Roseibium sp. Sym1]|uniref:hypothetical protein n=1 Tax=Roseibium sp. Sym1 TaxID=3016006 RepID=UPI0022B396C7|nr:hypothetical protein [Roseibium sp. Sym1]
MNTGQISSEAVQWIALVTGFLMFLVADLRRNRVPLASEPVTTNQGSIMMYIVWQAVIAIALSVVLAVYLGILFRLSEEPVPLAGTGGLALLSGLAGIAFGCAAKLRARDAGQGRGVALLGIIPLANLVLMVLPPKKTPERPPYRPEARPARILIGLAAIAGFAALWPFNALVSDYLVAARLQTIAGRSAFTEHAYPPADVSEPAQANGFGVSRDEKGIQYRFILPGAQADADKLKDWIVDTMLPETQEAVCRQTLVTEAGWTISYEYRGEDGNLIANVFVLPGDCPEQKQ